MFQRAKSFIIRRKKDPDDDLELPDSSHLVRRPVTANMQDRIDVKALQKNAPTKPNVNFDSLRQKSTSLEQVTQIEKGNLQKHNLVVMSSDGLDTIRRKKEMLQQQQKKKVLPVLPQQENKNKIPSSKSGQKTKLFRVNSKKKKNSNNQNSQDKRDSFIFLKMTNK